MKEHETEGSVKGGGATQGSAGEEKKMLEEKRFIIPARDSIKAMAESAGFSDIPDDVAMILSEDLSYRLREAAQSCAEYVKHAKRRRLTTDDFNDALRSSDVQPILGYGSLEPLPFKQTRDGEIHFVEDLDVNFSNIAFNSYIPKESGEIGIKSFWFAIEGVSKINTGSQNTEGKTFSGKQLKKISNDMLLYYDYMVKAILGGDEEAMIYALTDLKTNSKIMPLLPYFVNFVSNGVKTVSHDISQLTRLLHTVKALINNPNLYLEPEPYLGLLVQSVMYCALEPLAASINPINDHWVLRDYAARLLGHIVRKWGILNSFLYQTTLKNLKEVLYDLAKPFCSHYGAVMGLMALGTQAVEGVLVSYLATYWPHLNTVMEDTSYANALLKADAHKVYGAMQLAVEFVLKKRIHEFEEQNPHPVQSSNSSENFAHSSVSQSVHQENRPFHINEDSKTKEFSNVAEVSVKSPKDFYCYVHRYFGDSVSMKLPIMSLDHVFKPKKEEELVCLSDPDASKSGEELLEDLMEQVRIQLEVEHKEQLRLEEEHRLQLEQLKRERLEQERLKRERLEQEQLEQERLEEEKKRQWEEEERRRLEDERRRQQELEEENQIDDEDDDYEHDVRSDASEYIVNEIDEKSDNSYQSEKSAEEEEEEDDEEEDEDDDEDEEDDDESHDMDLTVKSTVSHPHQGIKVIITKRPKLQYQIKDDKVKKKDRLSRFERTERHKESKHSKRKKQNQRSSKDHDSYKFVDGSDDYHHKYKQYSKGGDSSSDGAPYRKLTLKLKVRDTSPKD